jgi:hypothetical protein
MHHKEGKDLPLQQQKLTNTQLKNYPVTEAQEHQWWWWC